MAVMDWSVVGDFETASSCDLVLCGAHRYAEDPTTEVISFTFQVQDAEPVLWIPTYGQDHPATLALLDACNNIKLLFVAHNAGFEKAIWRNIMVAQFGFPDIPNHRWHDTQAMCAMRVIPMKLERALPVLRGTITTLSSIVILPK